ncbi:MAG: NAD(P)H-dependent oxidoreductase [Lachnospiraceae bacterium]|nr:NAD(P)H-dependent oxidoreductase [Lachnospiraceae bacterium]
MHVLIINGSPRVKAFSNTDKILEQFTKGMAENGTTFEQYEVSDKKQWDAMRKAFAENNNILIALPLYVECIPGLLIEFLETVEKKADDTRLAFILQGGFAEGIQLRCGEEYLKILTERLGCTYAGTLVKGDNFSIRFFEGEKRDKVTAPYAAMGRRYAQDGGFDSEECRKFTGPEVFPAPVRLLVGFMFKTLAKKGFRSMATGWGCTKPLDYKPYM